MKIPNAKQIVLLLIALLVLPGCFSRRAKTGASPGPAPLPASSRTNVVVMPTVSPVGRVASVNAAARFVVLSYPVGQLPANGLRLNVFHGGVKTGELRVTGPERDNLTVADITTGSAQQDDEVRAD